MKAGWVSIAGLLHYFKQESASSLCNVVWSKRPDGDDNLTGEHCERCILELREG